MAITNHLNVSFNYKEIDNKYDFYIISTTDKYIPNGAYVIDKPIDTLHAESVVFDNGRSLFIMFKKNNISRIELVRVLEDEKITVKQIESSDIKDFILFKLFLYGINNFDSETLKFNNVTGKLFIVNPKWIAKNRKSFKALNINVDNELNIKAEATSFNSLSLFKNQKKLIDYPKYTFANKNNALKRVLHFDNDENVYIKKAINGKKAEIEFLNLNPEKIKFTKVFYIYEALKIVRNKYEHCLAFNLECIDATISINEIRDKEFMTKAYTDFNTRETNLVTFVKENEYSQEFDDICNNFSNQLKSNVLKSDLIKVNCNNIVYIHDEDYYKDNGYDDPYKKIRRTDVIQCVTVEDSSDKLIDDTNAIFETIIKETVIKNDIINKKEFTLDNWSSYNFKNDWIFGKEKDNKHYFIIVKPNGKFEFKYKVNDFETFNNDILDKCSEYLTDNAGKEKTVVADDRGNINIISRTSRFTLPSKDILTMDKISRGKESRDKYLSGVVDINYYNYPNGDFYYNVGLIGAGMNTPLPKASLLYKCDVLYGKNIVPYILETMSVLFVKFKSLTVLPYPVKYLNEFILMCESKA